MGILGDFRDVVHIIEWDLGRLKSQRVFIAMRLSWFIIQVFVFARAMSLIVTQLAGIDYYKFYLLGIYVSILYSTSISRGYVIADEFDDGIVEYHLALPVKRSILVLGRVLGSSLAALLFTIPMMLVVLLAINEFNPIGILVSLIVAYFFSMGVVGFVILVVTSVKSTDATDILFGTIDAILVRLSSIFYPLPVIQALGLAPYYFTALLNPLTSIADFIRILFLPEYIAYTISPYALLLYLIGFTAGMIILAIEHYVKKLEAGGWK